MKIGTIGYANRMGLSNILYFFREHLPIDCQMIINQKSKPLDLDQVKCSYMVVEQQKTTLEHLKVFLEFEPDVVWFLEFPFNWEYPKYLKENGVKVVYTPMLDNFGSDTLECIKDYVDLWVPMNVLGEKILKSKDWPVTYLPYPIDTDYFKFKKRGKDFVLLHSAGYSGPRQRKGTGLVLEAFKDLKERWRKLIVYSQVPLYQGKIKEENIDVREENLVDMRDLYKEGDLYLAPSKAEGLGLFLYECMACGIPIMTTDAPPMNEIVLDPKFLIEVERELKPWGKGDGSWYQASLKDLVKKASSLSSEELQLTSVKNRKMIEEYFSWKVLGSKWREMFKSVVEN